MRFSRRRFLAAAPAAGAVARGAQARPGRGKTIAKPHWPVFDQTEERAVVEVLRSGKWFRGWGDRVKKFEEVFAQLTGAKYCVATMNGTSALLACVNTMGVEAGDEVLLPPYTFVATVNVVLRQHALPIFVDVDPETFQMDARKTEAAVTERTRLILPVHIGGSPADMDAFLEIGKRRGIPVLEDACQAIMGKWRGRHLGTLGQAGCFSFQASKNLNAGEGGAILCNDEELRDRCYAFQNNGSGLRNIGGTFMYSMSGANLRMTEWQAAILMAQMTRLEEQTRRRNENARYLTSLLREIPGITPARLYEGCTQSAFHLYMFRYDKERFAGLSRDGFIKAAEAEGISFWSGYPQLNVQPFLKNTFNSRGYARLFPKKTLEEWEERTRCPENDRLCQEAVWMLQEYLLLERSDMERIADAVRRVQAKAPQLARA